MEKGIKRQGFSLLIVPLILILMGIFFFGFLQLKRGEKIEKVVPNIEKETAPPLSAVKLDLRQAYDLVKIKAIEKIGSDAEIFNAISLEVDSDGNSKSWVLSFCSPSKLKSVAIAMENGKVSAISPIEEINPEENEFCEPLQSNWKNSKEIAPKINCSPSAWHIAFHQEAENPEGWTWELICKGKFWAFDVYSGKLVKEGETTMKIQFPIIK